MRLRTKGYIALIGLVIVVEIFIIRYYVNAAKDFEPYQLWDVFNFRRDNLYEGGIGLLLGAIFVQVLIILYLVYQDRKTIKH